MTFMLFHGMKKNRFCVSVGYEFELAIPVLYFLS